MSKLCKATRSGGSAGLTRKVLRGTEEGACNSNRRDAGRLLGGGSLELCLRRCGILRASELGCSKRCLLDHRMAMIRGPKAHSGAKAEGRGVGCWREEA